MSAITPADAAGLWELMPPDAIEAVTLYSRTSGETFTTVSYPKCRRKARRRGEFAGGNDVGRQTVAFQLYRTDTATQTAPKEGDAIVDAASVRWAVRSVTYALFDRVVDCECLREF